MSDIYVRVRKPALSTTVSSYEPVEGLVLDVDQRGELLGVEILNAESFEVDGVKLRLRDED